MNINNNPQDMYLPAFGSAKMTRKFKKLHIEEDNIPYVTKALNKIAAENGVNLRLDQLQSVEGASAAVCSVTPESRFNNSLREQYYVWFNVNRFGAHGQITDKKLPINQIIGVVFKAIEAYKTKLKGLPLNPKN